MLLVLARCESIVGIDDHDFSAPNGIAGEGGRGDDFSSRGGNPTSGAGGDRDATGGRAGAGSAPEAGGAGGEAGGGAPGETDNQPPRVVAHFPDSTEGVDANEPIRIEFSEAMHRASVVAAYGQLPGRPTTFTWNRDSTVLTIQPGLEQPFSVWSGDERSGAPSELLVTYGVDARAQDRAGNSLLLPLTATYQLERHVEHRLTPCLELSGTASPTGFAPIVEGARGACVTERAGAVTFEAGDRNGEAVAAVLTFSLRDLPPSIELTGATLELWFDEPVGAPHAVHGTLWLEEIAPGLDLEPAFAVAPMRALGVLATTSPSYPLRPAKDVTGPVLDALDTAHAETLVQFRIAFSEPVEDENQSPDYVRLSSEPTELSALTLSYTCAACP
jgi:hypothetical protein